MEQTKLIFEVALLAGEILVESGAEIYRAEFAMEHILALTGYENIDVYTTTSGIMVTIASEGRESMTCVRHIRGLSNNLDRILEVNEVSRAICEARCTAEEAWERLNAIRKKSAYSPRMIHIGSAISCGFFSLLFGGGLWEFLAASVCGVIFLFANFKGESHSKNAFIFIFIKSVLLSVFANICHLLFPVVRTDIVIVGIIMPLVPGVAITNAVRDTLQGDYLSGFSRAGEAFVIALSIGLGVVVGLLLCSFFVGVLA